MGRVLVLLMLLFALSALAAPTNATVHIHNPFIVSGQVYCDTCRAGFETPATTYIRGATVKIECKDINTMKLLYSIEGQTDSTGTFSIKVKEDHLDQICDAVLVSSPQADCKSVDSGRSRVRLNLTGSNGVSSNKRYANSMGFMKDKPLSGCSQLLKQYLPLTAV